MMIYFTYTLVKQKNMKIGMSNATFYYEWLGVEKNQFRILSLLAPKGEFIGNLSDMCRMLNIDTQTRNRNILRTGISSLAECGFITSEQKGRTYYLKAIPQQTVIEIPAEWLEQIIKHEYTSENISWQAVLKVFLWIIINDKKPTVTRNEIAEIINAGVDTVTSALNVLEKDFNAIIRKQITKQTEDGDFRCIGLELQPAAWWE